MKDTKKTKAQLLLETKALRRRLAALQTRQGRRTPGEEAPELATELPAGRETILLVDDVTFVRAHVRDGLKESGYKVLEAANSEEALRLCESDTGVMHLLLTDVVMPGIDGRRLGDLIALVRPELKVLYMSGYSEGVLHQHGFQKSGRAFLPKPFTPNVLAHAVRDVLAS